MFEPDELLLALTEAGVDFVVIGGVAVGVHGFVRATKDLDIVPCPDPENLKRLADLLVALDAQQMGVGDFAPKEFPFDPTDPAQLANGANFRLETRLGAMDIMQWVPGIDAELAYEELAPRAMTVDFRGIQIQVCDRKHLRTMKLAASRPQDLVDLAQLDAGEPV
jgi:hypothetical protein